jgi:hypothetical protein
VHNANRISVVALYPFDLALGQKISVTGSCALMAISAWRNQTEEVITILPSG